MCRANVVATVAVAALLVTPVPPARTCSCQPEKPPHEALKEATAVFRGTVVRVDGAESVWRSRLRTVWCTVKDWLGGESVDACFFDGYAAQGWENYGFIATFRVVSVWKGPATHQIRVRSGEPSLTSCEMFWEIGADWVIYAYGDGLLHTNACVRNRGADSASAAEEAQKLGEPRESFQ